MGLTGLKSEVSAGLEGLGKSLALCLFQPLEGAVIPWLGPQRARAQLQPLLPADLSDSSAAFFTFKDTCEYTSVPTQAIQHNLLSSSLM